MRLIDLLEDLEKKLNAAIVEAIAGGKEILDDGRITYRFRLCLDAGNYKSFNYLNDGMSPEQMDGISLKQTNRAVKYINGLLSVTDSNIEGTERLNLSISTMLDLLIPLSKDKHNEMEFLSTIREVIDTALSANDYKAFDGFNTGIQYSIAGTGSREIRHLVGDSITLHCAIVYSLIANGVNSAQMKLEIDGNNVPFTRIGASRGTNQTAVVNSNGNGNASNINTATVFSINFDLPLRLDGVGKLITDFIMLGDVKTKHTVKLSIPTTEDAQNSSTFIMTFNDAAVNGERTLNASATVTMSEVLG